MYTHILKIDCPAHRVLDEVTHVINNYSVLDEVIYIINSYSVQKTIIFNGKEVECKLKWDVMDIKNEYSNMTGQLCTNSIFIDDIVLIYTEQIIKIIEKYLNDKYGYECKLSFYLSKPLVYGGADFKKPINYWN